MARRLVERGHKVTMVCASYSVSDTGLSGEFRKGNREGVVDGIRVIEFQLPISNKDSLPKRTWTFLKYSLRSCSVALFEKYDLAFATSTPLTAAIPALAARWLRWKPYVFEVRDLWPELPKAMGVVTNPVVLWAMGWLERRAYKSATNCIGLAPGIVDGIAKYIPRSRVTLIPNGCDLQFLDSRETEKWRPEPLVDDDFVAVFTGTHGQANGLGAVLDAAKVLQARGNTQIKFLLVGDGKLKPKLQARANAENIENVIFHDSVSKTKIASLLAGADMGLQILANIPAFYYGTSPNKFFDYLAAGKPVLTNYPGWVADLIAEHDCGVAVPPDDPEAFADALESLASDRDSIERKSVNSRALAESEFDRGPLSDQFVDVLVQSYPGIGS